MNSTSAVRTLIISAFAFGTISLEIARAQPFVFGGTPFGTQDLILNGTTTLQATSTGFYNNDGFHDATNPNYIAGALGSGLMNDFFVFNLANVSGPITSAELSIGNPVFPPFNGYVPSTNGTDVYSNYDVTTPISTLTADQTNATSIFNDLGTGILYGSVALSLADNGTQIKNPLDSAALTAIAGAEGKSFAIGGTLTTTPLPAGLPIFATGLGGLGLLGWLRKRKAQAV